MISLLILKLAFVVIMIMILKLTFTVIMILKLAFVVIMIIILSIPIIIFYVDYFNDDRTRMSINVITCTDT